MQAANAYQDVNVQSGVTDASPHQLIAMLMDGALDRISSAKGAMAPQSRTRGRGLSQICLLNSIANNPIRLSLVP